MIYKLKIFIDGSCIKNPGPGGYGIILNYKSYYRELSGGYKYTTNNRMELMASIIALKCLIYSHNIIIITDSEYLRKGITNWIFTWKKLNWKNSKKKTIKNIDLWKRLNLLIKFHNIKWVWIKGHSGNIYNERCNKIAYYAARHPFMEDTGYK